MLGATLTAVALALFGVATPASAETPDADKEAARAQLRTAQALHSEGRNAAALEHYKAAYALATNPITGLALGHAYERGGQLVEAQDVLRSVVALPVTSNETDTARRARKEAKGTIGALNARIPRLTIVLLGVPAERNASLHVDAKALDANKASIESLVNPGTHVIEATLGGGEVVVRSVITVAERQRRKVELRLGPASAAPSSLSGQPLSQPQGTPESQASGTSPLIPPPSHETPLTQKAQDDQRFTPAPDPTGSQTPPAEPTLGAAPVTLTTPESLPAIESGEPDTSWDDDIRGNATNRENGRASSAYVHDGFYLRLGLGAGALSGTWEGYDVSLDVGGPAVELEFAIGGTIGRGFAIGGGVFGGMVESATINGEDTSSDVTVTTGLIGPMVDWYLNPKNGAHLQAAFGLGVASVETAFGDVSATGAGIMGGGGYDVWVGEQWSLGGLLRVTHFWTEGDDNGSVDKVTPTVVSLLVSTTMN